MVGVADGSQAALRNPDERVALILKLVIAE